ncbi:glycosyltransferase [Oricola sp.]|uniref:glycosyltransferase family 2 protein n=1 Tax=Oricola sp. TaxID=1979950 RepID=UPI0025F14B94|nr:glycosyltransferase [Oricola sp.]MCI5078163.1 glycosyltransferase [Oricola sp.]
MPKPHREADVAPRAGKKVLCETVAFLSGHRIPDLLLRRASRQAERNGTTGADELLAHDLVSEETYYRLLAAHARLAFVAPDSIAETLGGERQDDGHPVLSTAAWCRLENGAIRAVAAPSPGSSLTRDLLHKGRAAVPEGLALTTPSALRKMEMRRLRERLGAEAANRLANDMPRLSAKHGASAWHGFALAVVASASLIGIVSAPVTTFHAIQAFVALFFLANAGLRLAAAIDYRKQSPAPLRRYPNTERPVYSVIVALYQEAPVVADLVAALKLLNWPRTKLEIKLVCEEDDAETLAALAAQRLDPRFEIITVPRAALRTKPKALNFALPFCSGSLVTLYDAEDRPHPDQLEEAWQTFRRSSGRIAALQAPLVMANPRRSWISALFHLEYAAQFRGLLPFLTRLGMPVPLGGTSTHFRRHAIERCGLWDPHNVTEDADLGFRLWRAGYRIGVLKRPTLEDAPHTADVWLRQRTRWIKGWFQTWLVNTRPGGSLPHSHRWSGAAVMHTLLAGTVVCSLFFPLTLFVIAVVSGWGLATGQVPVGLDWLSLICWTNIALAFAAQALLALRAVDRRRRLLALRMLPALPAYWLLGSVAGWRAMRQYFTRPFLWEKTPHGPHDPSGESHSA